MSESSSRMLLLIYNLWTMFVRVLKNQGIHSEAIRSRYELLMISGRIVTTGRRKTIVLSVSQKLATFLKAAYQRLHEWLSRTAPQLTLSNEKPPPWTLFNPQEHPLNLTNCGF